ncbi:DUF998 domain-containing protein [Conyzicola nivalis]|uniref:DUF998 domain-containing protein n=1 Tax=Conyzicola nivalis TaxID=1477021 RepID=A0A916SM07_9MICO|nr:DUF998 domain-containing protein [Conyzicola nivalis]GGB02952.1 hypothetical protein GCM10010979_16970 [Conyzicola nivalis]
MTVSGRCSAGALAFIVGALQYVTLEAVAAAAWIEPRYDHAANYISDLGVPDAQIYGGRDVYSPLAWVMNTGFVLEGVFFVLGAVLLAVLFRGVSRWLFVGFAVLHGVGIVLVGLFNEAADAGPLHLIGALLAIVFGNLTALVAGVAAVRAGLPRWFSVASVVLPVVGLLSEGVLLAGLSDVRFDGLWERGGVYSVTVWQLLIGVAVLATLRAARASSPDRGRPVTHARRRT